MFIRHQSCWCLSVWASDKLTTLFTMGLDGFKKGHVAMADVG